MKFLIDFEKMPEYVLLKTSGPASAEGFFEMVQALVESPQWKFGTPQIVDHRELDLTFLSSDDLKRIKDILVEFGGKLGPGACAFVMGTELGFGFARMYEILSGNMVHARVEVFYSFENALAWINKIAKHME